MDGRLCGQAGDHSSHAHFTGHMKQILMHPVCSSSTEHMFSGPRVLKWRNEGATRPVALTSLLPKSGLFSWTHRCQLPLGPTYPAACHHWVFFKARSLLGFHVVPAKPESYWVPLSKLCLFLALSLVLSNFASFPPMHCVHNCLKNTLANQIKVWALELVCLYP